MSTYQQRVLDGLNIDQYQVKFSGQVDVDSGSVAYGDEIVVVLTARVMPPSFKETPIGDLRRTDVLKPIEVAVVRAEARKLELRDEFGFMLPPPNLFVVDGQVSAGNLADENETTVEISDVVNDLDEEELDSNDLEEDNVPDIFVPDNRNPGLSQSEIQRQDKMLANFLAEATVSG